MKEVISVKFNNKGRSYFFDPADLKFVEGDKVVVETVSGIEFAIVSEGNHSVEDETIVKPLKKVLRAANKKDLKKVSENKENEKKAFGICEELVEKHKLDMKLVDVEYSFDGTKIVFCFTSDGRVDFRELVKDLASKLHARIELRQIGVRDEARMLGGLGICGQPYCCKRFLNDFEPVSIKMAKEQGLSLNPTKISGSCGRLMCCLKYEQNSYDYLNSITPNVGATVETKDGVATVIDSNPITGNLIVKLNDSEYIPFKTNRDEVKLISRHKKKQSAEKKDK